MEFIANVIYSIIRISTPIIFVAICSTISAQAGLLNMAGESMMLVASLAGVIFSAMFQNVWLGILCGMLGAMVIVLIICFAAFYMKVDLYLMSISMNLAMGGGVIFVMWVLTGTKANTAGSIPSLALGNIDIPIIKDIPILGSILSGHNVFTYMAILMAVVVWFLLFKTKLGLRMRAIGENPAAAEAVGINTKRIYTIAFLIAAAIGALVHGLSELLLQGPDCQPRLHRYGRGHHRRQPALRCIADELCFWYCLCYDQLPAALYQRRLFAAEYSFHSVHRCLHGDFRLPLHGGGQKNPQKPGPPGKIAAPRR